MLLVVLDNWYKTETETDSWVQYLKARVVHTSMDREYGFRAHTFCHCVFCSDSDVNYSDYRNNC